MRFYKLLICIVCICMGVLSNLHAQNLPTIPSPQTWDFMAYGRLPIGLHTGQLDLEIPLYHYKDNDFDIPITLAYNSAGFIPSKPAGPVGLNWFLNCGGVITRRVVGHPDDMPRTQIDYSPVGIFWRGIDSRSTISKNITPASIWEIETPPIVKYGTFPGIDNNRVYQLALETIQGSSDSRYEPGTADIFEFNFLGHKGKFVSDVNGNISTYDCVGGGTYKVDVSKTLHVNSSIPGNSNSRYNRSQITIHTGDGYSYTFGGNISSLEYAYYANGDYPSYNTDQTIQQPIISAWYLTKIEAPNGRIVSFGYENNAPDDINLPYPTTQSGKINPFILTMTPYERLELWGVYTRSLDPRDEEELPDPDNLGLVIGDTFFAIQFLKAAFIKEILVDGIRIVNIDNSEKNKRDIHLDQIFDDLGDIENWWLNYKIDGIGIRNKQGNHLKYIEFEYIYKGPANKERMFLDRVNINNTNTYTFGYIIPSNMPRSIARNIDLWGFWNGGEELPREITPMPGEKKLLKYTNSIIPSIDFAVFNQTRDVDYLPGHYRTPSNADSVFNAGLLNSITYPTGGRTEIMYEPHSYQYRLERRSQSLFLPDILTTGSNTAGGARVLFLKDFDQSGTLVNQRNFSYGSGILESWPITTEAFYNANANIYQLHRQSSGISVNIMDERYIGYRSVVERFADGSKTESIFNSYLDSPDSLSNQKIVDIGNSWGLPSSPDPGLNAHQINSIRNIYRMPDSHVDKRGKLKQKKSYNKTGTLIEDVTYTYDRISNDYIPGVMRGGDQYYSYKIHTGSYLLKKSETKIYDLGGSNPITTTTTYSYNSLGLMTKESQVQSDGGTLNTYTRYMSDLGDASLLPTPTSSSSNSIAVNGTVSTGFTRLSSSMPGIPVEQTIYKKPASGNEVFISASTTFFKPSSYKNNIALPYQHLSLHASTEITDYYPLIKDGSSYKYDKRMELEVTYDSYDQYDNITQHTGRDGLPVSYLWSYKGQYPIAKIVGASYSDVSSKLSGHSSVLTMDNPSMVSNIEPMVRHLRTTLPQAQISGYSYIPLVGLSAEISPNGLMTYYKYDTFGRLRRIVDHNNKTVEQYTYHYANQEDLLVTELEESVSTPSPPPPPKPTIFISATCEFIGGSCIVHLSASNPVTSNITVSMQAGGGLGSFQMTLYAGSSQFSQMFNVPGDTAIEIKSISPISDNNNNYTYQQL